MTSAAGTSSSEQIIFGETSCDHGMIATFRFIFVRPSRSLVINLPRQAMPGFSLLSHKFLENTQPDQARESESADSPLKFIQCWPVRHLKRRRTTRTAVEIRLGSAGSDRPAALPQRMSTTIVLSESSYGSVLHESLWITQLSAQIEDWYVHKELCKETVIPSWRSCVTLKPEPLCRGNSKLAPAAHFKRNHLLSLFKRILGWQYKSSAEVTCIAVSWSFCSQFKSLVELRQRPFAFKFKFRRALPSPAEVPDGSSRCVFCSLRGKGCLA